MRLGERTICDVCGASIGDDAVTLSVQCPGLEKAAYNGYIAHYHPKCFDDVDPVIEEAAQRMPDPPADSVSALEAIPVAHENVIRGLRRRHRMPDGRLQDEIENEQAESWLRDRGEVIRGPEGIGRLGLSNGTHSALSRAGLIRIADVEALSFSSLLALVGIGATRAAEIRAAIERYHARKGAMVEADS